MSAAVLLEPFAMARELANIHRRQLGLTRSGHMAEARRWSLKCLNAGINRTHRST